MTMKPVEEPVRVLIVDDDGDNRELLEVIFSAEGYVILSAASGEEALALAAREAPDLILLDIMMPHMDGYQTAAKLKGELLTRHIPILMLSALDDRHTRALALNAGAEDVMSKPLDRGALCARVRDLVRPRV